MSVVAVSIAVGEPQEAAAALRRAAAAVEEGARLLEWRLDRLAGSPDGIDAARALVEGSPAPVIATCRGVAEGGAFDGTETQRAELYEALILGDHPPRYADIELSAWQASTALRDRVTEAIQRGRREHDVHTSLILSVHDFEQRPRDLLQRVEAMTADPACAVIKVAWNARSVRDNLEALELLADRTKPTIALCMGRFGLMSRVLAPKGGGLLVYAADAAGAETAPGQPTVGELHDLYRFDRIGPGTGVYGVIGWPAEHSLGPAVHNAGFEAAGFDGVYLPLPVPPEYEHFKATVNSLVADRRLGFRGASVTVPHKEHLLRYVAELGGTIDPAARRIGAANTLTVRHDGTIECANTDAPAVLSVLEGFLSPPERRVAVLGAGGAARAVVESLSRAGLAVTVFNRTQARAQALAAEFQVEAAGLDTLRGGDFSIIVNCTPVGMTGGPAPHESPLPDAVKVGDGDIVFDTVYTPRRTPLIERAQEQGATVVTGIDMFLRQAALQFEMWTGHPAPLDVFERAAGP